MRTMTYKCDRCGKPMTSRMAVKLNTVLQRGNDASEKKNHDFCAKCFLVMKKAWANALSIDADEIVKDNIAEPVNDKPETDKKRTADEIPVHEDDPGKEKTPGLARQVRFMHVGYVKKKIPELKEDKVPEPEEDKVSDQKEDKEECKKRGRKPKLVELPVPGDDGMVSGPINAAEKAEFLRLYVEEGLEIDEIARRMHRLTKGVRRAIHSMEKSGEMESYRKECDSRKPETGKDDAQAAIHNLLAMSNEEDAVEDNTGSGATNAGISRDAYTGKALTTVYDGKRYDVGGIMALYRAGWKTGDIASEKNYDEDVVRLIIEDYYKS